MVPDSVTDEQALFLSDIFPTGYMAAVNAQIEIDYFFAQMSICAR